MAELTGDPVREVNFYLLANNIPMLQQVPGFEDFDPQNEVLHCDKPGTGLVDAPRAFSLKLKSITTENAGWSAAKLMPNLLCVMKKGDLSQS